LAGGAGLHRLGRVPELALRPGCRPPARGAGPGDLRGHPRARRLARPPALRPERARLTGPRGPRHTAVLGRVPRGAYLLALGARGPEWVCLASSKAETQYARVPLRGAGRDHVG